MIRRRRTLRGRVSLLALAVIAGWLAVLTVIFNVILANRLDSEADGTLRIRAQAASSTLQVTSSGRVTVRESATDSALDSSVWIYSGRAAVERAVGGAELQEAADALAQTGPAYSESSQDARFFALPVRHGGQQVGTVVVALNIGPYQRAETIALIGSALVSLLVLIGAYPVLRFAASRALRPVGEMTRQAADWSANSPGQRFGPGQRFEELQALASNLDALLDRLSAVLRHERQLSAELSHELRTPLAHIAAEVDLLLNQRQTRADEMAAQLRIRERTEAMNTIIETLLSAARAEQQGGPAGACSVDTVFAAMVAGMDSSPPIAYEPSALVVGVDAPVLERIIGPIIDNARRYARSRVWVHASRSAQQIAIDISNDGPPLDPTAAERIFEPGFRAGDHDDHPGVGLGLALARRLARAADGDVSVRPGSDVTTFRVMLPPG